MDDNAGIRSALKILLPMHFAETEAIASPNELISRISDFKPDTRFRKGNIGFVFQSFNLIDELNVYENVELPLRYLNISASERKRKVTTILKRMNISHRAKHFPQQLSGGQQQRVAIARAVVAGPKLILADEPTGNLDSRNGKEVMDLLTELNREDTTSHSIHAMMTLTISTGWISYQGRPEHTQKMPCFPDPLQELLPDHLLK